MLIIDKDGKVTFDGDEVLRKDINSVFLDSLFRSALKREIEFVIDETDPISKLFSRIKEETDPKSSFSKQIEELRSQLKTNSEEVTQIENAQSEDDLPF
jgi:hypothetical protein